MYENVKLILDISKERNIDLHTARDMAMNENQDIKDDISSAFDHVLNPHYYDFVTLLRCNNKDDVLEQFCNEILPTNDRETIVKFINKETKDI